MTKLDAAFVKLEGALNRTIDPRARTLIDVAQQAIEAASSWRRGRTRRRATGSLHGRISTRNRKTISVWSGVLSITLARRNQTPRVCLSPRHGTNARCSAAVRRIEEVLRPQGIFLAVEHTDRWHTAHS